MSLYERGIIQSVKFIASNSLEFIDFTLCTKIYHAHELFSSIHTASRRAVTDKPLGAFDL